MGGFYAPDPDLGPVRVVAFSGRESDAPLGIWGAVAGQLGRKEQFNDYYAPLAAPGQTAWVNLLRGEPLVIMLDELPPYFVNAASKSIGNSDLSAVTTTALSNLLVAVGRDELRNVCLVISDLKASYGAGAARIGSALDDLEAETGRAAMNLEPVRMNTDEFYRILRKRIFETLPDEAEIGEVAQGYAGAVREAKQMDVTNASPEQFARQVAESYPFHPALRDLYGRFRENQGFQQTRGLIRLMRIVVSRIWATGHDPYLIAAHDLDPGSRETLTEINQINPTLENAIAHDVASGGNAVAETIDANLGGGGGRGGSGSEDAQDVMRLLPRRLPRQRPERGQGARRPRDRGPPVRAGARRLQVAERGRRAPRDRRLVPARDERRAPAPAQRAEPHRPRDHHRGRLCPRPGHEGAQGAADGDLRAGRGRVLPAPATAPGGGRDRCPPRAGDPGGGRAAPGRPASGPRHAVRAASPTGTASAS